jgi:nickel superoxide dismutase
MTQKIIELDKEGQMNKDSFNSMVRFVWTKEEHARKCKDEILILWTDYFKPEHLEKFPELHDTFWKTAKLCSKAKQTVDEQVAKDLVAAVDAIADIFMKSKTA